MLWLLLGVILYLTSSRHSLSRDGVCLELADRHPQPEVVAGASSPSLIGCTWSRRARCNCDKKKSCSWMVLVPLSIIYRLIMSFSASCANCATPINQTEKHLNFVLTKRCCTDFKLSLVVDFIRMHIRNNTTGQHVFFCFFCYQPN